MAPPRVSQEIAKWEGILRAEGLAPIDQIVGGRVVVRTEIITQPRRYLPEPERLAAALEAWLAGDRSGFTSEGLAMLRCRNNQYTRWRLARDRARVLLRVCVALADSGRIRDAITRPNDEDIAHRYLRPLYRCLAEVAPQVDDDEHADDGDRRSAD